MPDVDALTVAAELARNFLDTLPTRPVGSAISPGAMRSAFDGTLPDVGIDPARVVREMAEAAEPGLVASAGPRYFGFVIGGSLPAALAADWLTSAWDQNAGLYVQSPAAAVVEEIAAAWLLEIFGLPRSASVGFVTGCQMANFTCLAAARHRMLARAGWDVEERGLFGAPELQVVVGEQVHVTVLAALRMLGLGAGQGRAKRVPVDAQGRMRPEELRRVLTTCRGPTIVCAQAGEVNTGAFDPFAEIAEPIREHGAWLHVDGAFGLWAAASPGRRHVLAGVEGADSWATDAHKWLNVPYDSGIAIVSDAAAHRAALQLQAVYLQRRGADTRDASDFVPEASRRARGFAVYAALRSLGRRGVAAMVDRCCVLAARMADRLRAAPLIEVVNDVVLNQVLVRFRGSDPAAGDALTGVVISRVQDDGTCWLGGTTWKGRPAMRVSVSGWSTTEADIDRSAEAIIAAAGARPYR